MPVLLRRSSWGGHLLVVLAIAAATALGLWQLHAWRVQRDAARVDLTQARPVPLAHVMGGDSAFPGKDEGRPVTFTGTWLGKDTLYVSGQELHGRRGYWVVTPVLIGKSAMPVVRGWVAHPHAATPSGTVSVVGWLQASQDDGSMVDSDPTDDIVPQLRVANLVQKVSQDLYSAYVVQHTAAPAPDASADVRQVTPAGGASVSGFTGLRNFLYALQWWVFGAFAVFVWWRWLCEDVLGRRRPRSG